MSHPISRRRALALSAGALVAPFAASFGAEASKDNDSVKLMFDYLFSGQHAPFFYGIETGIFARHGIDLTLLPGTGSRNTALAVAAGQVTFGIADATVLLQALQRGTKLKAIYCFMPTTPFGICYKKSTGITKPTDLEHHSYGDSPGTATYVLWSLFLKKAGGDPSTVKVVDVSPSAQWSAFVNGAFDATLTAMNDSYIRTSRAFPDAAAFAYADYGFNVMSKCVVARPETQTNRDLTSRFTAALTESLQAAQANMNEAVDALRKQASALTTPKDQLLEQLRDTLDKRIRNANTQGKPLGWMHEADWQTILDIPGLSVPNAQPVDLSDLYTNNFIRA